MIFAAAMSLFSVVAHMRQANGDVYAAHIASTAAVTVNGQAATQQTDTQGLRFLLRRCSGAVCPGSYFDGEHLYEVTINGTALRRSALPDADMRAVRDVGELNFLSPGFTDEGGRLLDGGTVKFANCLCRRIYVSDPLATPSEVFVDPHTWMLVGAYTSGGSVFTMHDYRRVGPYRLPFRIERDGVILEQYTTRNIVATPLQPPQGLSVQLGSRTESVPLDPASTTPDSTCTLGGITVRCMFDTGNSGMSMSLELAEQLNLNPVGVFNVSGLGNYATEVVRAGPLQIGSVRFGDAEYVVLADIHRYGYDLILGADVLAAAPVTIDYPRHTIVFGSAASSPDSPSVDLSFENFVPVINVLLAGQPARLAVDTGDQSYVNLSDEFYGQHSSLFTPTHTENVSGVGGSSVEMIGEIPSVTVGTITTGPEPIGTTRTLRGTANGHLGAGFLSNYIVLLDYLHQRMELRPKHA